MPPRIEPRLPHGFFAALILAVVMVDALLGHLVWKALQTLV
jgi:hypothetical protein